MVIQEKLGMNSPEQQMAEDNLIYKIYAGSKMYGTNTPESDTDFGGIFIPNKDYIIGLKRCDQVEIGTKKPSVTKKNTMEDTDYTVYSLPKFIHLAVGNNPNIIEYFFAPINCILKQTNFGAHLIKNYPLFISKKSYHTFKGYAYQQRKKLILKRENMTGRVELIKKHGYDTKYASHLLRMLIEGQQILSEGLISLPLPQNTLIRDVKLGAYSLDWVLNKAEELEKIVDTTYANCKLQNTADIKKINELQMNIMETYWNRIEANI